MPTYQSKMMQKAMFDRCVCPGWKLWLAKLLGRKQVTHDGCCQVTSYHFLGRLYVDRIEIWTNGR